MNQNTDDKIWEDLFLSQFPNTPKNKLSEARTTASIAWLFDEPTVMGELYDKYVMLKRLTTDNAEVSSND